MANPALQGMRDEAARPSPWVFFSPLPLIAESTSPLNAVGSRCPDSNFRLLQFEEDFDIIMELRGLFVLRSVLRRVATTENGVAYPSVLYGWRNGILDVMRTNINNVRPTTGDSI